MKNYVRNNENNEKMIKHYVKKTMKTMRKWWKTMKNNEHNEKIMKNYEKTMKTMRKSWKTLQKQWKQWENDETLCLKTMKK